jgi:hypothetical protein
VLEAIFVHAQMLHNASQSICKLHLKSQLLIIITLRSRFSGRSISAKLPLCCNSIANADNEAALCVTSRAHRSITVSSSFHLPDSLSKYSASSLSSPSSSVVKGEGERFLLVLLHTKIKVNYLHPEKTFKTRHYDATYYVQDTALNTLLRVSTWVHRLADKRI